MNSPIRLIIADDHALFRQGLKSLLLLHPEVAVVGEVSQLQALYQLLSHTPCDLVLLDLQMERWLIDDIEDLARLTTVVVLTASESPESGVRALRLGARAFVQKRFAIETLLTAIHTVAQGLVWMPPEVQAHFAGSPRPPQLTAREADIVRAVAAGRRNAAVARQLAISESTVKTHLNNIFQKLGLRDRLELTHYAIRTGLAGVGEPQRSSR